MDIQNIQRKEKKVIRINLKTTKKVSSWLKENNVSPQLLFDEAVKELMIKGGK